MEFFTLRTFRLGGEVVDRPTQLIHIGICKDTSTKDTAGQVGKGEGDQKAPKIIGGYSGKEEGGGQWTLSRRGWLSPGLEVDFLRLELLGWIGKERGD